MARLIGTCPKCQGNMFDEDGAIKCLQCSKEIGTKQDRTDFYMANSAAILNSETAVGRTATIKRFNIPPGTMPGLLKRLAAKNGDKPAPAPGPKTTDAIPELPAFSNDWAPEVQLKWLDIWAKRRQ